jgi:hypothetical protein
MQPHQFDLYHNQRLTMSSLNTTPAGYSDIDSDNIPAASASLAAVAAVPSAHVSNMFE